jgi:ParB family transcriptional regulator, chromosome partitioning protein
MTSLHLMAKKTQPMLSDKLSKDVLFGISGDLPRIIEVELQKLRPNPDQPRTNFSQEAMQELASSIEQHGLIQPIAVVEDRENEGGFIIVAGERRYRAYKLLGKETIPAITTSGNPDEIALIENMQREDLSPIDEAEALEKLMGRHNYKQEDLAKVIGKARTTVVELLSLNNLPEEIKSECRTSDTVSKSVLIEIVRLGKAKDQLKFWKSLKQGQKKTVRAARAHKGGKKVLTQKSAAKPKQTFHTTRQASVIVQAESPKALSREQVIGALEEALEAATKA